MVCKNCETKNTQDAKFCKKCGKSLVEEVKKEESVNLINTVKENIIGIFKKPIDTIKEFTKEDNYQLGIIYIALSVVLFSILMLVIYNDISSSMYMFEYYFKNAVSPFRIFLLAIILYLLVYATFGGITYLVSKYLYKKEVNPKELVSWLGINTIITSITYLALIILIFVSYKLAGVILLMSNTLSTFYLYKTIEVPTKVEDNKLGYLLFISTSLTTLIVWFVCNYIIF